MPALGCFPPAMSASKVYFLNLVTDLDLDDMKSRLTFEFGAMEVSLSQAKALPSGDSFSLIVIAHGRANGDGFYPKSSNCDQVTSRCELVKAMEAGRSTASVGMYPCICYNSEFAITSSHSSVVWVPNTFSPGDEQFFINYLRKVWMKGYSHVPMPDSALIHNSRYPHRQIRFSAELYRFFMQHYYKGIVVEY
jgi:hypothetical protein